MMRIILVLSIFIFIFIQTVTAHASDWVFVAGDKVRAFSLDTQNELPGSPIALNRYARDFERSPGGGLLYVLHDSGRLGVIRARNRSLMVSAGASGAQSADAAVSPNRADIWISGGNPLLHQQDAAGFGPSYGPENFPHANRLEATAVSNNGTVYLYDRTTNSSRSHGWIWSFDPTTGRKVQLVEAPFSLHGLIADRSDRYLLAVGQSGNGIGVILIDRAMGTILDRFDAPIGAPYSLAVSRSSDKVFVGTDQGILPFQILDAMGSKPRIILPIESPYYQPSQVRVLDLAVDSQEQLQVLYEDSWGRRHVGEFDAYGNGPRRSFLLPDETMNFIEVVPESVWNGLRTAGLRERLVGLLKAAETMKLESPFGGLPLQIGEDRLDPKIYKTAYVEASRFLKKLGKERLTPKRVAEFIAEYSEITLQEADLYLDEVFLLNQME